MLETVRIFSLFIFVNLLCFIILVILERDKWLNIFGLLALPYPVGKVASVWFLGPNWLRWWVGDFGFVFSFVFLGYFLNKIWGPEKQIRQMKVGAFFSFFIAISIEILTIWAKELPGYYERKFLFAGDWVDAVIYIFSFILALFLIKLYEKEKIIKTK